MTKLTAAPSVPSAPPVLSTPPITSEHFKDLYDSTLYLGSKEASGRVLLGLFLDTVRKAMQLKHDVRPYVDHEYRILETKTYACDVAVIAALSKG